MSERKAVLLVLLAAFVSGFSIFLNKFAVSGTNAFVFTTFKNAVVAIFIFSAILLFKEFDSLKRLSKKNWFNLALIGLVGGSAPFLIYFFALQQTSAINAGFLHKTIFVFAGIFAIFFHKEKICKTFIAPAVLLLAGNYFLFSKLSAFAAADLLVLAAVILWAVESVFSKCVFTHNPEVNGKTLAFGRMFFGSLFMLAFLLATNQLQFAFQQTLQQLQWVLLTSIPLFLYVLFYFSGLRELPVHKATAFLMLGQPITVLLSLFFFGQALSFNEAIGILLTLCGILLLVCIGYFADFFKAKKLNIFKTT